MIDDYIKNIPKAVQNIIYDGVWESKTIEIGKKYGLNDSQIDTLANYVVLVLIGIEKPEDFLSKITSDLGISNLLAEQIVEDLENRVFDYALKQIEKEIGVGGVDVKEIENKEKLMSSGTQLELRPENLPMVEKGEVAKDIPKPIFQNEVLDKQIPIGVPRYAETPKTTTPPYQSNPIIEKKLGNITPPTQEPPRKYEKDPYREPLS